MIFMMLVESCGRGSEGGATEWKEVAWYVYVLGPYMLGSWARGRGAEVKREAAAAGGKREER